MYRRCLNLLKALSLILVFFQCSNAQKIQLASFVPPPLDASPPLPDATLTVFPDGHALFDDILLSALVIDRKMTLS